MAVFFNDSGSLNGGVSFALASQTNVSTIKGTSGDDRINNTLSSVFIDGLAGNDRISNHGVYDDEKYSWIGADNVTISGGTGNDSIYNGGQVDDHWYAGGDSVVVSAGNGDDYVHNESNNVSIAGDSGNDNIVNEYDTKVTINAGTGNDSIVNDNGGNNVIYGGAGNDSVRNILGNEVKIYGDKGNDTIINDVGYDPYSHIDYKAGSLVTIYGGAGNDYILNNSGNRAKIYGGAGNDTINNNCQYISDFKRYFNGEDVTINAGLGNDRIRLHPNAEQAVIQYAEGDGKDTIYGFNGDTLQITKGAYTTTKSGSDIIVQVGKGKIILDDAIDKSVSIVGNKTQQQVIRDFMATLDTTNLKGNDAVSSAINISSNGLYSDLNDLVSHMCSDIEFSSNVSKFLNDYCGISSSSMEDTGSITGKNVGSSKLAKSFADMIPENGDLIKLNEVKTTSALALLKDVKRDGKKLLFTKKGLTVEIPNYYKNSTSFETKMSPQELTIINGLYTWWIEGALNLVKDSYGSGFSFTDESNSTVQKIVYTGKHKSKQSDAKASVWSNNATKNKPEATSLELWINLNKYNNIGELSNRNGVSNGGVNYGEDYLDVTLAHEFTHGIMASNINYYGNLPTFIKEGMAELTTGSGFSATEPIDDYKKSTDKKSTELIKTLKNDKFSDPKSPYRLGYMFLRYFAKQVSENTLPSGLSYMNAKTKLLVTSSFKESTIDLKKYATVKDIDASKNNNFITIKGNDTANIIKAGTWGSELYGQKGDDTLYGGSENDTFFYADGDGRDVIVNYTTGTDKIKLTSGEISSSKISGADVILNIGNGSIRIKNSAGKKITVVDSNGNETAGIYGVNRKVSSLWFADEDTNFSISSLQIDSITENKSADYYLGNVDVTSDWTALTPTGALTSGLTYSEK